MSNQHPLHNKHDKWPADEQSPPADELSLEARLVELGLNAPRLNPHLIDSLITGEEYHHFAGTTTTVCLLRLPSNITVTGTSDCASLDNFNAEAGRTSARRAARDKIWDVAGVILKDIVNGGALGNIVSGDYGIERIARMSHEINRTYCNAIGDDSQVAWEEAPEWQRKSAINGVRFHLANPNSTPKDSHDSWLAEKVADGWVYGPVKSPELKQHPCMLPYDELPIEQRVKDYLFRAVIHLNR